MDRARHIGKYRLIALLARGGQAEVFLAVSRAPEDRGRLVVVKRLAATSSARFAIDMFLDEACLAELLRHPNIVETYETGQDGGDRFIAMEYLDGQTFSRVRRVVQGIAPEVWAWLVAEALQALEHVHGARDHDGKPLGIVHCDVSPQNIFVTYDGRVKLIDFGVARFRRSRWPTEVGMLTGKIRYMAPEQVLACEEPRSDLFAMGTVLWEAIAGRRLFVGSRAEVVDALLVGPVPALSSVVPSVDPELERIVSAALARMPNDRFSSAREMRDALLAFSRRSGRRVSAATIAELLEAPFRVAREQKRMLFDLAAAEARPQQALAVVTVAPPSSRSVIAADAVDVAETTEAQAAPASLRTDPASLAPRVLPAAPVVQPARALRFPRWTALAAGTAAAIMLTLALQQVAARRRAARERTPAAGAASRSPHTAVETLSPRAPAH